jgi:hypothetical protein
MNKFAALRLPDTNARPTRDDSLRALTEVRTLANFVRTFELNSNTSSHDWHVQPSCQRPNSPPPERRVFSPERSMKNPSVLETLQKYRLCRESVNLASSQDFHKNQLSAFSRQLSVTPDSVVS